jgi:hypothetical protein
MDCVRRALDTFYQEGPSGPHLRHRPPPHTHDQIACKILRPWLVRRLRCTTSAEFLHLHATQAVLRGIQPPLNALNGWLATKKCVCPTPSQARHTRLLLKTSGCGVASAPTSAPDPTHKTRILAQKSWPGQTTHQQQGPLTGLLLGCNRRHGLCGVLLCVCMVTASTRRGLTAPTSSHEHHTYMIACKCLRRTWWAADRQRAWAGPAVPGSCSYLCVLCIAVRQPLNPSTHGGVIGAP